MQLSDIHGSEFNEKKVARAVQLGVPCFLAKPPWTEFLDSYEAHAGTEALTQKLLQLMVSWSDLSIEFRRYRNGQLSVPASNELRQRPARTKTSLDSVNMAMEEVFSSERHITQVKSSRNDQLFETVLDFKDYAFAVMLALHDSYELIVNRMLSILDHRNNTLQVERRNKRLVTRICRSYEYAWKRRPMEHNTCTFP